MDDIKEKTRSQILDEYKWRTDKIYKDNNQWESDFKILKEKSPKIISFQGKLNQAEELLSYFEKSEIINRLAEKLLMYAHLRSDEDTSNTEFQILKDKIDGYIAEVKGHQAFFIPEILTLSKEGLEKEIQDEQGLKIYEFLLDDILRHKPHALSLQEETIMATVSDCLEAPANIFSMLSNADMTFPTIVDEDGKNVELTESNYSKYIKSKDRRVRKEAFAGLFTEYEKYKNTFSTALTSSIKNFIFNSKIRKYSSSLESSLQPNNIPLMVYDNVVNTVDSNLDSLHRYVKIKKKLLGLEEIHIYDLYVPIIDTIKEHMEFKKGVEQVKEALIPLGKEYLSIFSKGVEEGWIDIYSNKGKRKGAYSWGSYDTMPYVLLNYNNEINDVSTLAHEMGHSIHSYYAKKSQPYVYSQYTLFCAEVASTTNEILLIHHLIDIEKDEEKRLYLINTELEQIRTTVFRQTMFAEFEKVTHERIEEGNPLTSTELSSIWHDLNLKYFGEEIVIDSLIDMEWARIPHFYSDFYVYQYATGYSAANSFAKKILKEGDTAVNNYLGFLKSGGSDYSINILQKAGVNMLKPLAIEDTIERFNELLDMLEAY